MEHYKNYSACLPETSMHSWRWLHIHIIEANKIHYFWTLFWYTARVVYQNKVEK
jgi:hypothetical protein